MSRLSLSWGAADDHNILPGAAFDRGMFSQCLLHPIRIEGNDKVEGVPFYIKKQVLTQETVWASTNYSVSVNYSIVDVSGKVLADKEIGSALVPSTLMDGEEIRLLRRAVLELAVEPRIRILEAAKGFDKIDARLEQLREAARKAFANDGEYGLPNQERLTLVSNKIKRTMEADPTRYYINGRAPLFGTGTGNFELTPDMTLTKAESTVEDKTAETLLGIFPLTEFFTKQWALQAYGDKPPAVAAEMQIAGFDEVLHAEARNDALLILEVEQAPQV